MAACQTHAAQALARGPSAHSDASAFAPLSPSSSRSPRPSRLRKELLGSAASAQPRAQPVARRGGLRVDAAKRVQGGKSLVLNSTLVAEEGKEADVARLCESVLHLAEERKKDVKSGIISFACHTDAYETNVVHFWERYDTFLSMNDFHASPEYTRFLYEVRPLLTTPVQLAAYEYKDGQIGCMLNPIGPKGEGGLDDATGQGGSGGGASYRQTSQSVQQGITEDRTWGLQQAVDASSAASEGKNAAQEAAAAIAKSLRSIFGGKGK